jgi:hypothetical protein
MNQKKVVKLGLIGQFEKQAADLEKISKTLSGSKLQETLNKIKEIKEAIANINGTNPLSDKLDAINPLLDLNKGSSNPNDWAKSANAEITNSAPIDMSILTGPQSGKGKTASDAAFIKGQDAAEQFGEGVKSTIESSLEGVGEIIGNAMTGKGDFGKGLLNEMGTFAKRMGALLIAYGMGMDAFKKAFTNPYVAIAAGIALIAVGSAISNMASSGPAGSGGGGYSSGGGGGSYAGAGMQIKVVGVLRGEDIYVANARASDSLSRR